MYIFGSLVLMLSCGFGSWRFCNCYFHLPCSLPETDDPTVEPEEPEPQEELFAQYFTFWLLLSGGPRACEKKKTTMNNTPCFLFNHTLWTVQFVTSVCLRNNNNDVWYGLLCNVCICADVLSFLSTLLEDGAVWLRSIPFTDAGVKKSRFFHEFAAVHK